MTVTQSLVLVLIIALWATGNGINIATNTVILIILLIALIALARTSCNRSCCPNNFFNNTNLLNSIF